MTKPVFLSFNKNKTVLAGQNQNQLNCGCG